MYRMCFIGSSRRRSILLCEVALRYEARVVNRKSSIHSSRQKQKTNNNPTGSRPMYRMCFIGSSLHNTIQ